jgi:4-hydroxy-4-methyl-2-oxoglutarate aldolase
VPDTPANDLLTRLARLHPAVVSDCLDAVGVRNNVIAPTVRPVYPEAKLVGVAAPVQAVEVDAVPEDSSDHYRGVLDAVDALEPGDVMVVSTVVGSVWGELLSTAATFRGARGILIDGYTRDVPAIIKMRFPVFATGISPSDSLGRIEVVASGVPVECGGVTVNPGDLVLGDYDGVAIIPRGVAETVIQAAEEKISGENLVRSKLAEGMPVSVAFREYGVI